MLCYRNNCTGIIPVVEKLKDECEVELSGGDDVSQCPGYS